jgi:hypothetical protein
MKFIVREAAGSTGYIIGIDDIPFKDSPDYFFDSSYHILCARVLGYSYPDYLRYCRSKGAKLHGKQGYSYPIFENHNSALKICGNLNLNWSKLGLE